MLKKLNLRELLNFYDYRIPTSNTHASAINAVLGEDLAIELMKHYFGSLGYVVVALDESCTQGTQRGNRLDKWFVVENGVTKCIYQVEIKNWSAHSIGGRVVQKQDDESYMQNYRIQRWKYQFSEEDQLPSQKETLKVLTKMRVPNRYADYTLKSLLCFWEPLHPNGKLEAMFEVDVNSEVFHKLAIFSMSNYVSLLLQAEDYLEVEMSDADARIDWLRKIYS